MVHMLYHRLSSDALLALYSLHARLLENNYYYPDCQEKIPSFCFLLDLLETSRVCSTRLPLTMHRVGPEEQ